MRGPANGANYSRGFSRPLDRDTDRRVKLHSKLDINYTEN